MNEIEIPPKMERLARAIDSAWEMCMQRIASGRIKINKEASLQLHLGFIIQTMGELACVIPGEQFTVELETQHEKQNIDIFCTLDDIHAAIELKCFKKSSNRATDTDMYDVLKDLARLENYSHAAVRRFVCLTDNPYYSTSPHSGHAGSVSIRDGQVYDAGREIVASWRGNWQDKSRDKALKFSQRVTMKWNRVAGWYFLYLPIDVNSDSIT